MRLSGSTYFVRAKFIVQKDRVRFVKKANLTTVAYEENGTATLCYTCLASLGTLSIAPGDQSSANHERNTKNE
jgi:hypothetical protein